MAFEKAIISSHQIRETLLARALLKNLEEAKEWRIELNRMFASEKEKQLEPRPFV